LLVARGYSEGVVDLDKKIRDRLTEFDNSHRSIVKINFSNSFSTNQRDDILTVLKTYADSNSLYKVNSNDKVGVNDVIVALNLKDLSIKTKPSGSMEVSKYLAGYQNVPNPVYNNLILVYNQAQANLLSANQNCAYNPNFFTILAKGIAQGQLNSVANALASTPQYVQEPVYQDYQYQQIDYKHGLHIEVDYEITDALSNNLITDGKFEDKKEEITTAISGVHPKDSSGITNKEVSESDAQDTLSAFSKKNIQGLSETIVNLIEKKTPIQSTCSV
jgi:hypothetical protein